MHSAGMLHYVPHSIPISPILLRLALPIQVALHRYGARCTAPCTPWAVQPARGALGLVPTLATQKGFCISYPHNVVVLEVSTAISLLTGCAITAYHEMLNDFGKV